MAAKEGFKLIVDLTPLDVPYLRNIVAVSERSLREDPRTISKFVEALSEGIQFYRNKTNREENMRILAKYLRVPLDKNRAMIEEGYETYRDMQLRKPYADPGAMKILLEIIAESNPKAKNVKPGIVDRLFFRRAAGSRRGFRKIGDRTQNDDYQSSVKVDFHWLFVDHLYGFVDGRRFRSAGRKGHHLIFQP